MIKILLFEKRPAHPWITLGAELHLNLQDHVFIHPVTITECLPPVKHNFGQGEKQ